MRNGKRAGFTLIELLVALAIVGLITAIAAPRYFGNLDRAKENVLKEDLYILRDAIGKFYADRNRYPDTLQELVQEQYLRKLPADPFTRNATSWIIVPADDPSAGLVADVRSGAPNQAHDGTWMKDW
jgi:general secretion pathway protein G